MGSLGEAAAGLLVDDFCLILAKLDFHTAHGIDDV